MRILIVKMSSMGDVVHALPVLRDINRQLPEVRFDWLVEEGFEDIPALHPLVDRVIPVAIRRWRKHPLRAIVGGEIKRFIKQLRAQSYDLIVDAQGLLKSALVSRLALGPVAGFDALSARESVASMFYGDKIGVEKQLHAVERQRRLFAGVLGYEIDGPVDYGMPGTGVDTTELPSGKKIMLLHGTSWESKLWPLVYWRELCRHILEQGYQIAIPSGSNEELERARAIGKGTGAEILPPMTIKALATAMRDCEGVITVDTGLGHLATSFNLPLVALYGATDPALTGTYGPLQRTIASDHLPCIPCKKRRCQYAIEGDSSKIYPPCFAQITPETVWQALQRQINLSRQAPV